MNRQLSALPDSKTIRILLPYNRQYVIFAVYEVLDTSLPGTVRYRYPKGNDRHSRQYIAAFGKRACDKQGICPKASCLKFQNGGNQNE